MTDKNRWSTGVALVLLLAAQTASALDFKALAHAAAGYESGAGEEPLRQIEQLLKASVGKTDERAPVEAVLISMLGPGATFEAKRFACYTLAVFGSESSIPALSALLQDDATLGVACFALGRFADAKAGDALRTALVGAKGPSRVQLVVTLGQRAEPESAVALAALAQDVDVAVAAAALRALGNIDTPEAHQAVMRALDALEPVRAAAARASALALADSRLAAGDQISAAKLCDGLLGVDLPSHVRRGAYGILLRCDADGGAARVRETLLAPLSDPILGPVAIVRVATLPGGTVSKQVGNWLPRLPATEQTLLIGALMDRGDTDAQCAIRSQVSAADADVRRAAVAAVGTFGDAADVPLLLQAVTAAATPEEEKDARTALVALRGVTVDQALAEALRCAPSRDKPALIDVLARRGGEIAVPLLLALAVSSDTAEVRAAGQGLARVADGSNTASLDALCRALASDTPGVRDAALRTLAAWRGLAAWETLAGVYAASDDATQRGLALRGLVRMAGERNAQPDPVLLVHYRCLLAGARTTADRSLIVRTLAGVAHLDALVLVVPLLDEPGLREDAEQAVDRIARAIQKQHPEAAREALSKIK